MASENNQTTVDTEAASADREPTEKNEEGMTEVTAETATTELERTRSELESTKEQLLRRMAEFQNYRRRTELEKGFLIDMGKAMVIRDMLDVLDDLERSVQAAEQAENGEDRKESYTSLKEGVELVYKKFRDALAKHGVEPIEAVGQPFDEERHEAVMQQPAPEGTPPGIVLQELQKGYRMGDRILRHAKVIVSA
ncbi:nucleotide exchange factor GrpE [Rhodocaloribacter sp.]